MYLTVILGGENRCCPCILEACRPGLTRTMWTRELWSSSPVGFPRGESQRTSSRPVGKLVEVHMHQHWIPTSSLRSKWGFEGKQNDHGPPPLPTAPSSLSVVTPFSTHFLLLHVKNSFGIHIISLFSCSVVIFSKNCTWTLSILFCLFQLTCCFCFYFYYLFSFMYCQLLCCFFGTF